MLVGEENRTSVRFDRGRSLRTELLTTFRYLLPCWMMIRDEFGRSWNPLFPGRTLGVVSPEPGSSIRIFSHSESLMYRSVIRLCVVAVIEKRLLTNDAVSGREQSDRRPRLPVTRGVEQLRQSTRAGLESGQCRPRFSGSVLSHSDGRSRTPIHVIRNERNLDRPGSTVRVG